MKLLSYFATPLPNLQAQTQTSANKQRKFLRLKEQVKKLGLGTYVYHSPNTGYITIQRDKTKVVINITTEANGGHKFTSKIPMLSLEYQQRAKDQWTTFILFSDNRDDIKKSVQLKKNGETVLNIVLNKLEQAKRIELSQVVHP